MRSSVLLSVLATLSSATVFPFPSTPICKPEIYEAIHQAEYRLADTLDRKDYDNLGNYMTKDIIYDNSQFGPGKGGVSRGLAQVISDTKAAFGTARISHLVTNAIIDPDKACKSAHVITYLVFTRWDQDDLKDPNKTYRVFEKCDDTFVLDGGSWKLKNSVVTNQGPKFEQPYFGTQ